MFAPDGSAFGPDTSRNRIRGEWIMRFWIAALSVAGFFFSADAALADKRGAFVVGNNAHKNVAPPPNPAGDAQSIAQLLPHVGFYVVAGSNLTPPKITPRLLEVGKK